MPGRKKKSYAQRKRQQKELKRDQATKQHSAKSLKIVKSFTGYLEKGLPSEVLIKIKNVDNNQRAQRLSCLYKSRSARRRRNWERNLRAKFKLKAIAVHFFFRMENNVSAVIPYHLNSVHRKRIKIFKLACLRRRIHKTKLERLRRFRFYKKEKDKYQRDKTTRQAKQQKCKAHYRTNAVVKARESTRMRTRYQTNQLVREKEQARNRLKYQQNEDVRQREQERNRRRYHSSKVKEKQKDLKKQHRKKSRHYLDKVSRKKAYQDNEELRNKTKARSLKRYHSDPTVRSSQAKRKRLSYRDDESEREKRKSSRRLAYQENEEVNQREKSRNRNAYQKYPEIRTKVKKATKARKRRIKEAKCSSLDACMAEYLDKIARGPTFVCCCCVGLFYEETTKKITMEKMYEKYSSIMEKVLCFIDEDEDFYRFCGTCHSHITRRNIPRIALSNGLDFPEIPEELKGLNRLEVRMVSLRIPFANLRPLGSEGQWGLRGNVVNVENNLQKCVQALPRRFDEMSITQLKFKRRMSDKHHFLYDKIRPKKVVEAVKYLLKTPMYARHNVLLNENWDVFNADEVDFIVNEEDREVEEPMDIEGDEMPNDINEEHNIGAEETLYFTNSTAEPLEVHIAPGEGNVPMPIFRDPDAEYLSFPQIYCGQEINYNPDAKISTTDRARSEIRRNDRRCAIAEKIFYIFKLLFVQRIRDAFQIALRQKKSGSDGGPITAKQIRTPGFLEQTLNKNDGYTVFKNVRSTPAYWKDLVKRVVAMVRQLGNCALFITFSAAETKWNELLVILMKVLKGKDITEEEAEQLSYDEKCDLIRSDPVTCARHFDHKYRALKKHLLSEKNGAFSPHGISDYYSRIEYQMRGSPHSHGLYWIKDAPQFKGDEESAEACIAWIDKYITCKRDDDENIFKFICYQNHSHSHSCYKCARTTRKCRFHFPRPPLPRTMILAPLDCIDDTNKDFIAKAAADYTKIEAKLIQMGKNFKDVIPFEDFIEDLDLTIEEYIIAIRSTIKRTAVFLKRDTNAAYINNYNRDLLYAWRANMDIQFVLDPYACAKYCVGYMLKSEGGMSKILKKAADDAKRGNFSIAERLKQFGSILINGTEISSQEAVGFVIGLKNTDSSRGTIFINTNRAEGRIGMLKSQKQIEELPDDSEDICIKGLLDRYTKRSEELNNVCLADFAAFYEYTKKGRKHSTPHDDIDEEDTETKKTDKTVSQEYWQQDQSGFVKRRKKSKIIRYRHFSKITEPTEYYRERLMLFLPWRDETKELVEIDDHEKKYFENIEAIRINSKEYQFDDNFDEEILRQLVESEEAENEDDDVVTNELQDLEDERYAVAEMTDGPTKKSTSINLKPPKMLSREEYCNVMRSLNVKQRQIVNEVLHRIKTEKTPFYIFLSGGAGVGKSHVITAIVQSILHYRFQQNGSPEDIPVVVTAPTGKAAFNVAGMTLHTAFKLTAIQGEDKTFVNMDGSTCNTLRIKYAKTDLFVVDEISMVGSRQGGQVSERLSQVYNTPVPEPYFGGKPVIVCGDFRQLPPFGAYHIFKSPTPVHENTVPLNPLWEPFEYFELDEIMRQKGEFKFCKALNNMAKGQMDQEDIDLMKSREIRDGCRPHPEAVYLFQRNNDCAAYNSVYHGTLNTQGATSVATDKIYGRISQNDKQRLKNKATTLDVQKSDGLMYKVQLQVGGIFMVTTNVDVADGIFNGSTGVLKHIEFARNASERVPIVAWMQFLSPVIGQETRNRYKLYKRPEQVSDTCVPIERHTRTLQGARKHMEGHDLVRSQIPLLAANAMTIAKSQGSTLENVVVNTSIRKLDRNHLYVACSRATTPNGLWFQGKFKAPDPPPEGDAVEEEIKRLKKNPVKFSQLSPVTMNYKRKIYFHNIETFRTNKLDVEADQNINCCDVVAFVEHHVHADQQPTLNGFQRINFVPCKGGAMGDSRGSLIFSKLDIPEDRIQNILRSGPNGHFIITVVNIDDVYVVVCYKHPNFSSVDFTQELTAILNGLLPAKIVLLGDVNINIAVHNGTEFKTAMRRLNLKTCLAYDESTTNKGTQIDICFSNMGSLLCSTYETYYSYHRGICVLFN